MSAVILLHSMLILTFALVSFADCSFVCEWVSADYCTATSRRTARLWKVYLDKKPRDKPCERSATTGKPEGWGGSESKRPNQRTLSRRLDGWQRSILYHHRYGWPRWVFPNPSSVHCLRWCASHQCHRRFLSQEGWDHWGGQKVGWIFRLQSGAEQQQAGPCPNRYTAGSSFSRGCHQSWSGAPNAPVWVWGGVHGAWKAVHDRQSQVVECSDTGIERSSPCHPHLRDEGECEREGWWVSGKEWHVERKIV